MGSGQLQSLAPLALLAMREAGADGCALYRRSPESATLVRMYAYGVMEPDNRERDVSVASFMLRLENGEVGKLVFAFRAPGIPEGARHVLEQTARTMESIWSLYHASESAVQLASRVGRLQAELADVKIADRVRGFLVNPKPNATGIIAHHVQGILQARRLPILLESLARELEDQLAERQWIAQAKNLLQGTQGLSEEQAYAQLRVSSRKSRRRLGAVAQQFIERQSNLRTANGT